MSRKIAREVTMQAMYQIELNGLQSFEEVQGFIIDSSIRASEDAYVKQMIDLCLEHKETIDEEIAKHLKNWTIDRISKVDLSILRLALIEIRHMEDIPESVSINEAVNLAKKFSDEEASKYINGVLGSIVKG
jgi:N utilization substance protein B